MSQTIDRQRQRTLERNLLRVTAPSPQPDEKYRPTHWSDRIYYLVVRANAVAVVMSQYNWNMPPAELCGQLVSDSLLGTYEYFERLEQAVAEALVERFGDDPAA